MRRSAIAPVFLVLLVGAAPATGQSRTDKLALLFEEVFGPNGLKVNSEQVLPDGSTHSAHFNSGFQSNFTQINIALASQLASLPLPSPASGFTYRFDTATGTFVRTTQSFGPILTDRAETIGRGRFSFGYNFQFFSFDSIEGLKLDAIPAVFTHDDYQQGGGRADVVTTRNSVEASVTQMTAALTYGVTGRFDLSLAVPVVRTSLSVRSDATIQRVGTVDPAIHFFRDPDAPGGYGTERQFSASGNATGLGDVIVRAKGTVLREGHRGVALGLDVRFPTGDETDLLGSGAYGVKPFAAFSTAWGPLAPHVDVGYQWNGRSVLAGDVKANQRGEMPDQLLFAVGADLGVNDRFSLALDLLGQRVIDSTRLYRTSFTPQGSSLTFPDVAYRRSTYTSAAGSVGFKVAVSRRVLANFNLRFMINDAGLVDRAAPLIGLEYGF